MVFVVVFAQLLIELGHEKNEFLGIHLELLLNKKDEYGKYIICYAAVSKAVEISFIRFEKYYRSWKDEPFWFTCEDNLRMKPLDYAVENGQIECVKYLIDRLPTKNYLTSQSADINDRSCFIHAIMGGNLSCVKVSLRILAEFKNEFKMIHEWATKADFGYVLKNPDWKGKSPVHYAVLGENPEILHFLLEHKFQAHKQEETDGLTPLALAAKLGKFELVPSVAQLGILCINMIRSTN
ncbi:hypothetical protein Ciccas_009549 [Cichlidogyrus casuarinus]|uniref:Uncharacterized protein n=1 Tax=Cichlidogyrus casuarinus TaxID=1844966 RepID=A0ABD2PWR5_9PLAT